MRQFIATIPSFPRTQAFFFPTAPLADKNAARDDNPLDATCSGIVRDKRNASRRGGGPWRRDALSFSLSLARSPSWRGVFHACKSVSIVKSPQRGVSSGLHYCDLSIRRNILTRGPRLARTREKNGAVAGRGAAANPPHRVRARGEMIGYVMETRRPVHPHRGGNRRESRALGSSPSLSSRAGYAFQFDRHVFRDRKTAGALGPASRGLPARGRTTIWSMGGGRGE